MSQDENTANQFYAEECIINLPVEEESGVDQGCPDAAIEDFNGNPIGTVAAGEVFVIPAPVPNGSVTIEDHEGNEVDIVDVGGVFVIPAPAVFTGQTTLGDAAGEITINHNLDVAIPEVQVYEDATGEKLTVPTTIIDSNNIKIAGNGSPLLVNYTIR